MVHGRDSNRGEYYFGKDYKTYQSKFQGLLKSEWRAVYYENIIRSQSGVPLRTHYGVNNTPSGPTPIGPPLLNNSNQPINYQV